jgi:sialate O-acetylesterase
MILFRITNFVLLFCVTLILSWIQSDAAVRPNSIFADHVVLQKGMEVPVWGAADDGEKITVTFNGQTLTTVASGGKWMVRLKAMPYVTNPQELIIAGSNTVVIRDVLVGEVWLCSGQSNMERQLGPRPPQPLITNWEKERDDANFPLIRQFYVPLKYAKNKVDDVHGKWSVCSPQTVSDFSAVGYFFAKNLYMNLNVPVGILFSAFGGTPAEDWMSYEALASNPAISHIVRDYDQIPGWRPEGKVMNGLYNGMIYPLIPFAFKGVAWYQGENNNERPKEYQELLPAMIQNWRNDFRHGEFPFLIVQVAPNHELSPELREAQLIVTQKVRNAALIVTTDCGDRDDIHPPFKQPVGERLALAARGLAYNQSVVYSGPVFKSMKTKGGKAELSFTSIGNGLVSRGGALKGFTIAGADGLYYPAEAEIRKDKVLVRSSKVAEPRNVRYGWENVPDVNLYNREGLPASPFRTDVPE